MKIHPTAIIEDGAKIGEGCEVGPYSIVGSQVVIGAGTKVDSHCVLSGRLEIGEENRIGVGCVLGAEPQDFAFAPDTQSSTRIGNRNRLREYVTIHRGTKPGTSTVLGSDCFLMVGTHLGHNSVVGDRVVIANNCLLGGYVEVHDGAVLGGGSAFHQFIRIGKLSMTRGGTRFARDIPPFSMADDLKVVGLNSVGLRRAGLSTAERANLRKAFDWMFHSGKNVTQALESIPEIEWTPYALEFFQFFRESNRGVSALSFAGRQGRLSPGAVEAEV